MRRSKKNPVRTGPSRDWYPVGLVIQSDWVPGLVPVRLGASHDWSQSHWYPVNWNPVNWNWCIPNPEVYQRLHSRLLIQPTRREKILQQMMRDPVKFPEVLQPKIWNQKILCPRYLFDSGLTVTFRKEFKQWWKKYYGCEGSPVNDVKIRLSARTNRTLEHCFIHKKPTRELLTRMEPTTTTTTT